MFAFTSIAIACSPIKCNPNSISVLRKAPHTLDLLVKNTWQLRVNNFKVCAFHLNARKHDGHQLKGVFFYKIHLKKEGSVPRAFPAKFTPKVPKINAFTSINKGWPLAHPAVFM